MARKQVIPMDSIPSDLNKLLDKEELKDLADRIVSEEVDEVIVVYRDKANNSLEWATTATDWAKILGAMSMANTLMREEWHQQRSGDD